MWVYTGVAKTGKRETERKPEMMKEQEGVRKPEDELLARGHFELESRSIIL